MKIEIPCLHCHENRLKSLGDPEILIEDIKIRWNIESDCLEISGKCPKCKTYWLIPLQTGVALK